MGILSLFTKLYSRKHLWFRYLVDWFSGYLKHLIGNFHDTRPSGPTPRASGRGHKTGVYTVDVSHDREAAGRTWDRTPNPSRSVRVPRTDPILCLRPTPPVSSWTDSGLHLRLPHPGPWTHRGLVVRVYVVRRRVGVDGVPVGAPEEVDVRGREDLASHGRTTRVEGLGATRDRGR